MRPKLQKHSALKLAGRIIPQSGGYNIPQLAAEYYTKLALGFHTRDIVIKYVQGVTKFRHSYILNKFILTNIS
jgi:hypothetical protein